MKMLIISGAPNTGKTTTIREIYSRLCKMGYTDQTKTDLPENNADFTRILALNNKVILIHSATDDTPSVNILFDNIKNNYDLVITSCRDMHDPRKYFFSKLHLFEKNYKITICPDEFPLARITRRNDKDAAIKWYQDTCANQLMNKLKLAPYNL